VCAPERGTGVFFFFFVVEELELIYSTIIKHKIMNYTVSEISLFFYYTSFVHSYFGGGSEG